MKSVIAKMDYLNHLSLGDSIMRNIYKDIVYLVSPHTDGGLLAK